MQNFDGIIIDETCNVLRSRSSRESFNSIDIESNMNTNNTSINTPNKIVVQIIHYYTHFIMFVIFEILFYFLYVVAYEKKLVFQMIGSMAKELINFFKIDVEQYKTDEIFHQLCYNVVNTRTNTNNTIIYNNALYLIFGMTAFLIFLIIVETNFFTMKSTFPQEFKKSSILMFFIALFDFLFFSMFILKYKLLDSYDVLCYLYENT